MDKLTINGISVDLEADTSAINLDGYTLTVTVDLDECGKARLDNALTLGGYPAIPTHVECPGCKGEGGDEGPITCGGRCDWCGGCRDQPSACESCEGAGEVELDQDEQCHAHPSGEHCDHCGDVDADGKDLACCFCGYVVEPPIPEGQERIYLVKPQGGEPCAK